MVRVRRGMNVMKPSILLVLLVTALSGCSAKQSTNAGSVSPSNWTAAISPTQARNLSPQEAKAILVAVGAIELQAKTEGAARPDTVDFKARPSPNGWEVYVQFGGGYADGKPVPMPGNFVTVEIDSNWNVTRIVGGA